MLLLQKQKTETETEILFSLCAASVAASVSVAVSISTFLLLFFFSLSLSISLSPLPHSMALATNISFQFCDCASAMRKFCCKTKYFGICPHAGGNFVRITVCMYACVCVRVCIAHKLKCARDILLLLLFCLGVSEFLCCAVAAKLQPLCAVNLVNASGGRACPSLFPPPPSPHTYRQTHRCKRVYAQMELAVGSCMPFCRCQKVLLCLSLPLAPFLPAANPPHCCCLLCCGCCGHSLKFVAKSVYWFAMCNSHSMKIELFLWLLIGLQQGKAEGGRGRSTPGAHSMFACTATARLDA